MNERDEIHPRLAEVTSPYDMVDYVQKGDESVEEYRARLVEELSDPRKWVEITTKLLDEIRDNFQVRAGRIDLIVELLRHSPALKGLDSRPRFG